MNQRKQIGISIFILLSILLLTLPILLSFNDAATKIVERNQWYNLLQTKLVPAEIAMVGVIVKPFRVNFVGYGDGIIAGGRFARMSWNCLGWQSLLLFGITLIIAFKSGNFTWKSKVETAAIGILGVFLVNLIRISFIILLLAYAKPVFKIVFHDLLAAVVTITYLVVFWWFAYQHLLEEKQPDAA